MPLGINDAQLGRGYTISYSTNLTTTPIVYTPLATAVSIDGPGTTVGEVETPILNATTKQYLPTIPETELTVNIRHNGTNPGTIMFRAAIAQAPIPIMGFQLTYPDGYNDTFLGFAKGYAVSGGENETPMMAAIPIRATTLLGTAHP